MKILLLSPWLPYPTNWGFAKRVYHILEVLVRRHDVTLLTYSEGDDADSVAHLRTLCTVHTVPAPSFRFGKRVAQLASLASTASFQHHLNARPAMQQAIDDLTRRETFDIIHVATSQMACFRFPEAPVLILDEHNIEYELYYRTFEREGAPLRRMFGWLEYTKFKREEIRAWHAADGCAMTSSREAAVVQTVVPGTPTTVVPNAVDTDYFAPADAPVDPDMIVLTGLMKYRPNVDGATFFVQDILPRILEARPNAKFFIVGGEPSPEVLQLASPHVVVTGAVDDVRPFVWKAAVVVVPLRFGSGTRLKVLEGLSMGKPMVSTALGCEGIDVVSGEHLLVEDDPVRFADAVIDVMSTPGLSQRLSRQGRELMLRQYRWDTAVEALEALYEQALATRRGALDGVAS